MSHHYGAAKSYDKFWSYRPHDEILSGAKFDAEADFDVHLAVARPKPHRIGKTQSFDPKFSPKKIFGDEKLNVRNLPKHVLAKFRADRSLI